MSLVGSEICIRDSLSYSICTTVGKTIMLEKVYITLDIMVLLCIPFTNSIDGVDAARTNDNQSRISEYISGEDTNEIIAGINTVNIDGTEKTIETRPHISTCKQSETIALLKNPTFIFMCMSNMIAYFGIHLLLHFLTSYMTEGW